MVDDGALHIQVRPLVISAVQQSCIGLASASFTIASRCGAHPRRPRVSDPSSSWTSPGDGRISKIRFSADSKTSPSTGCPLLVSIQTRPRSMPDADASWGARHLRHLAALTPQRVKPTSRFQPDAARAATSPAAGERDSAVSAVTPPISPGPRSLLRGAAVLAGSLRDVSACDQPSQHRWKHVDAVARGLACRRPGRPPLVLGLLGRCRRRDPSGLIRALCRPGH